jgi:hypothetical protein
LGGGGGGGGVPYRENPSYYTFLELLSHAIIVHIKIQMFVGRIRFSNNTPIEDCTHKLFLGEKSFVKVSFIVLKLDGCGTIKSYLPPFFLWMMMTGGLTYAT